MKVIIGSYRGPRLVTRAIESLRQNVSGITSIDIVDDSGVAEWAAHYRRMRILPDEFGIHSYAMQPDVIAKRTIVPTVFELKRRGYNQAMRAVTRIAEREKFLFWEEDFVATGPIDLNHMGAILYGRPYLAQLALIRNAVYPNEIAAGGMLPGLVQRLTPDVVNLRLNNGILEQTGVFTCNPAVWQAGIANEGWPLGKWSEERMTVKLRNKGYKFGFLPGERVEHDGVRSGFGY
jgi:hypothetical protein